jgi:hypothetical protein
MSGTFTLLDLPSQAAVVQRPFRSPTSFALQSSPGSLDVRASN